MQDFSIFAEKRGPDVRNCKKTYLKLPVPPFLSLFTNTFLRTMSSHDRIRNSRSYRNPMLLIGIAMTTFYVVLGALLLFVKDFLPDVRTEFRSIFAGMLIIYGIYRGWRVYADFYQNK